VSIQGKSYVLQIQESLVSTTDLVSAIVVIQIVLITVLLVGLILINRKLSKTIWDPFYTILDKLKKYKIEKDMSIELPRSTTAEFRDLSATVSQLVSTSHHVYQSQREFTENASHELQTPLAVIRSKIDMLMQTPLSEKQSELIHVMQDAAGRMARLNRNLLLLAKIENQQFLEREQVNLVLLVEKLIEQFREQIEQKGLVVETHQSNALSLLVNRTSMEVLITNLLTNAIRHSPPKSAVHIFYGKNRFSVSNAGEPLLNPEKIFDRFQRASSSNGSGIGLAIVKKICDSNGYKAQYQFENGMHVFTINFVESN
jgi:signal transduction histidine kinase